jgi:hypothetical protein
LPLSVSGYQQGNLKRGEEEKKRSKSLAEVEKKNRCRHLAQSALAGFFSRKKKEFRFESVWLLI